MNGATSECSRVVAAAVVLCASLWPTAVGTQSAVGFDVILRHGTILNRAGGRPFRADVGITNGRISKIGNLSRQRAAVDLNVAGLYVSPGFINIHSHPSANVLARAENMLLQGVTTEILNPDGGGPVDIAEQMSRLGSQPLAVNIGAYIGFNSVWSDVMGPADRRATPEDIARMSELIVQGLERGAWGVSAGLDYKPAYFAQAQEVIAVVKPASAWRTNFTNHDRLTPESKFSSRTGILETLQIAQAAGLVAVVTHMKVQGAEQGSAAGVLAMMREASARGQYTAADAYPYLAGQTALGALLVPAWAQDGGRDATAKRFADSETRARIAAEIEGAMNARFGGPGGVFLLSSRKELADVMRELQVPAGEAVIRVLEQSNTSAILRFGAEADLRAILQYPDTSIACDCGATTAASTHPRAYGTYPRVLGRYVRDSGVLTWPDAIRKMTALPASTIGMVDRGFLAPGMAADITVFDPRTVIDRATYEQPAQQSEGIRHVLVNGKIAVRDGALTGEQAGRVLARTRHMPSRPMSAAWKRRVAARGFVVGAETDSENEADRIQVAFEVSQQPEDRRAKGFFRLRNPHTGFAIDAKDLGVLQTAGKWAAFSGRGRVQPSGNERSFTVIVDLADPISDDRAATAIVEVEGLPGVRGTFHTTKLDLTPPRR